jgi:hypothetical protein
LSGAAGDGDRRAGGCRRAGRHPTSTPQVLAPITSWFGWSTTALGAGRSYCDPDRTAALMGYLQAVLATALYIPAFPFGLLTLIAWSIPAPAAAMLRAPGRPVPGDGHVRAATGALETAAINAPAARARANLADQFSSCPCLLSPARLRVPSGALFGSMRRRKCPQRCRWLTARCNPTDLAIGRGRADRHRPGPRDRRRRGWRAGSVVHQVLPPALMSSVIETIAPIL